MANVGIALSCLTTELRRSADYAGSGNRVSTDEQLVFERADGARMEITNANSYLGQGCR
jgi:hypothetical protein